MTASHLSNIILEHLPFPPTGGQSRLISALGRFLLSEQSNCCLLLKGYAGTGKTSSIHALLKALPSIRMKASLMAPTGRAAKVISTYTGQPAFTIHKKIYVRKLNRDGSAGYQLAPNLHKNTVFIVDEASMIGRSDGLASASFQYRDLLDDLMKYVFSGEHCRLILIGDTAQLPPVGMDKSPALDEDFLRSRYSLTLGIVELTEVVRQATNSGILYNATILRDQLEQKTDPVPHFDVEVFDDVQKVSGEDLEEVLDSAIGQYGIEQSIVITRSNKRANLFNQQIRHRILWHEEEVSAGEILMVVKNNYYWLAEYDHKQAPFIANGDFMEVLKIVRYTERYDFRFAEAVVQLKDYPDIPPMEVILLLDTLMEDGPSLNKTDQKVLFHNIAEDYLDLKDRRKIQQAVLQDPYFNALQVKFGYAVTCHKSQGGQWPAVFVDQGYVTDEMLDDNYLRWLYTAITRAQEKLYLVNFHDRFFEE